MCSVEQGGAPRRSTFLIHSRRYYTNLITETNKQMSSSPRFLFFYQLLCWNREDPYLRDILRCNRQKVDFVSQTFGGLDGGDVGIDQHGLDILLLQGLDSLENRAE